ncbi:zinc finger BED domain-containing protein RICESLEEPER 2-like [Bidens hawaiensis]|uniref:zinc finger BED domain-containing protein RICESLEEPER 2-like n=1 Tax=Bidens hawaiensis TaxID=980011 RepID=UPI004049C958
MGSRKRKLTSIVWNHFEKMTINGEDKAECHYCKRKLGAKSENGTRHLLDHYNKFCPKRNQRDIRQQVLGMGQKTTDGQTNLTCLNFDPDKSRKDLAEMVIVHEYPLVIVEHHKFRKFVTGLQPLFKVPSRNTLKSDILKIYDFQKEKTMGILEKNQSRIAITTDMWTSGNQKKGFMSITAHLIDEKWEMQSRIMRFIYVPSPHTAEVLVEVLYQSMCDWNIDRKISTVTVDNCSTNDLMIHYLLDKLSLSSLILGGELFHMRCCAHILNLIVQDGLSVIGEGIERIRESVAFWTGTQKRVEKFEEAARHLAIDCSKKLPLDCKTRWNSTYLMLKVAILYKEVFKRLKQRETQYKTLPTERDWELGSSICDKLSLFYELTLMFSGTKYPTANVFFPSICEIKSYLGIWKEDRDPMIKMMAEKMIVKFDKYWSVIHGVMGVAAVLDPRYKLKAMEFAFPKIYGSEKSESAIIKLKELVYRLFQDYESYSQGTSRDDGVRSSQNNAGGGRFFNEYFTFVEEDNHSGVTTELDLYLQEKVWIKETEIDLLAWWKTNGVKYPRLQKIARDILAIPISTVASESAFSTSGRLSRAPQSGASEATIIKNALSNFIKIFRHKSFPHLDVWEIARHHPKWEPVPVFYMDGPTAPRKKGSSSKRSKTSDSGNYTTSTDGLSSNTPNMNLNDQPRDDPDEYTPTPTRPHRKKHGESSRLGKETVAEDFNEYKSAKLAEMVETKERKQLALASKLKRDEAYINHLNENKKTADLTFIVQPHEHLNEPFRSILLQRKRELCEKWDWEAS